jgi:hypothetical protein
MFALLPPEMQNDPPLLLVALLLSAIVGLSLALTKKRLPTVVRVCFGGIGCVSLVILIVFCLFPPVARVERLYHQGHDQFYWGRRLHSKVPEERREAATALAALLKSSKSNVRVLVIQDLGECGPQECEIALEALLAFAKDEQESESLRWEAEYAIGIMFFHHVVGDIGTDDERESYQKMILAQGWDAAAREVANKKEAKARKP